MTVPPITKEEQEAALKDVVNQLRACCALAVWLNEGPSEDNDGLAYVDPGDLAILLSAYEDSESALSAAEKEIERLREALRFYRGDMDETYPAGGPTRSEGWSCHICGYDGGDKAVSVIGEK